LNAADSNKSRIPADREVDPSSLDLVSQSSLHTERLGERLAGKRNNANSVRRTTRDEALDRLLRYLDPIRGTKVERNRSFGDYSLASGLSVLKNAPHTAATITANNWPHRYSREEAAFPLPYVRANKFWPPVARIDNPFGDRNLFCSCPPVAEYA